MVSLEKCKENLNIVCVDLTKRTNINFDIHKAQIKLCLDYSGSMSLLYNSGTVQEFVTKIFAMALKFDDDGTLDVIKFHDSAKQCVGMDITNYETYISNFVDDGSYGGTNYEPPLKIIYNQQFEKKGFFKKTIIQTQMPSFVIFITDGENFDKSETDNIIRKLSDTNVFVQFIGIGSCSFDYLKKLDDLSGRKCDNTGFVKATDLMKLSDIELYTMLLSQYPEWLKDKGIN